MGNAVCGLCCDAKGRKQAKAGGSARGVSYLKMPGRSYESDDSRLSGGQNSPRPGSYMENAASPLPSFMASSFNPEKAEGDVDAEALAKTIRELKAVAKRLEGPVQKYPRSGKGIFKKVQERYVAIKPHEDPSRRDEAAQLSLWKQGQLAYWESAAGFKQQGTPKGGVHLLKIAKVAVSKDDARGRSVIVKHKSGDDMQELVLCFPTKRDAEEWSYALWEFISMLRGQQPASMHYHE